MAKANTTDIGRTGLIEYSGVIQEDFLKELRGKEAYKRYNEMRLNSPVIGALLLANDQAIRGINWEFTSDDENDPRIELLNEAKDNLSHSWNDHIAEALTMLPFGFSLFEIVYERGKSGRMLWRKFAPRGQETVYRWLFDEAGGLAGIEQMSAPNYKVVTIPIESLILYRTRVERGNPEGRSILRTAWIPYYYAKHIQQVEAIGVERDLAGLPVITLPLAADTSDNDNSDLGIARSVVRNVRNDQQAGIVLPSPEWKFELASTGGSRQFDTDKIVRRYESRMLMSALAQFLNLGQEAVGSLALSKDQTDFFTMSVNSIADIIAETFTKFAIPRLLKLNGYDAEGVRLEHSPAGDIDTDLLANTLQKLGSYLTWTAEDEIWLRGALKMPEVEPEAIEQERELKQARADAIAAMVNKPKPGEKKDEDTEDTEDTDEMSALAPDDVKRRRMERKLKSLLTIRLEATKKKVLRAAKEYNRA